MKDMYDNKMIKDYETKEVPKYIGGFTIWVPDLGRKISPGEIVPDFPIEEAKQRNDFILVKEH
jgi:hypothetical protein